MISKKQVTDLIKTLKTKTGKKQWELSVGAGYEKKTLSELISKGFYEEPYKQLMLVYGKWLNNSTGECNDISLKELSQDLSYIIDQQAAIIAEVRGYGQYLVMNANDFDDVRYVKAKALVDKIYASNLGGNEKQGKSPSSRKKGKGLA